MADVFFFGVVLGLRRRFNAELLGVESEFLRCYAAGGANDHVEQYHSRLLTLHPIRRSLEGRTAMFAYPTHTSERRASDMPSSWRAVLCGRGTKG